MVVELGQTIDPLVNARVHQLDRAVTDAAITGVRENVPAYASLLVHYDPLVTDHEELSARLASLVAATARRSAPPAREPGDPPVEIPVAYGGEAGPDLSELAQRAGVAEAEVVRRHASGDYRVAMIGFAPGFPYLMGMDPSIACPRLDTPRVRVPAGSVGIADTQTGIYPFAMPGGWRLIGRTDVPLFDPSADPPARLRAGMRVRFVPIERDGPSPAGSRDDGTLPGPRSERRSIRVLEPGFLATVQDAGRSGYERFGVPPSGAADHVALDIGNRVLGNPPDAAAIEITAGGAELEFLAPCAFALSGAIVEATLDGRPVAFWAALSAPAGAILRLGWPSVGLRAYLSVAGGLDVPVVLGARATYVPGGFGGLEGRPLRAGDVLGVGVPDRGAGGRPAHEDTPLSADGPRDVRVVGRGTIDLPFVPGGQWDDFAAEDQQAFAAHPWRVSHQGDRVGLRLEGDPLPGGHSASFVSDGTVTGAIQVAGDGRPIVLLVDRQTTGGYPKVGAVASAALHLLGQLAPGDEVRFVPLSVSEAQALLRSSPSALPATEEA